jgi:hypothetical protein
MFVTSLTFPTYTLDYHNTLPAESRIHVLDEAQTPSPALPNLGVYQSPDLGVNELLIVLSILEVVHALLAFRHNYTSLDLEVKWWCGLDGFRRGEVVVWTRWLKAVDEVTW